MGSTPDPARHRRCQLSPCGLTRFERAPDRVQAVGGHPLEPGPVPPRVDVEARAVVSHPEREVAVLLREPNLGRTSLGVLRDVV
jgi:hypothetical protein